MRLTISASASGSRSSSTGLAATSRSHASRSSSHSVAPAGLGYSPTTLPPSLERRKNARPIGIWNSAHSSSDSSSPRATPCASRSAGSARRPSGPTSTSGRRRRSAAPRGRAGACGPRPARAGTARSAARPPTAARLCGGRTKRRRPATSAGSITATATRTRPSPRSSGTGGICSASSSGERPARRSSKRRSHDGQVSSPPGVIGGRVEPRPAPRARVAVGQQRAAHVRHEHVGPADGHGRRAPGRRRVAVEVGPRAGGAPLSDWITGSSNAGFCTPARPRAPRGRAPSPRAPS